MFLADLFRNPFKLIAFNPVRKCINMFSISTIYPSKDPLESRFVAKVFKKNHRKYKEEDVFTQFNTILPEHMLKKIKIQPRAKPMLDANNPKLSYSESNFYETISNIVSSGQLGIKVTITEVRLMPDFSQMNVYWEATGDLKTDKKIQNTLNTKTKTLRHLITTFQESLYVPTISFMKDLSHEREKEFEEWFQDLDTGRNDPDSSEREYVNNAKTEVELDINYNQNVCGLPHKQLMKKVMNSKLKCEQDTAETSQEKEQLQHIKRRQDVKQYSKLLEIYSKKKTARKLRGMDLDSYDVEMMDAKELSEEDW